MRRRSLVTLLLLATVVVAAALLPQTPAGRGWLLDRARQAAQNAGWTVDWRASSGNPWRALELRQATVEGPGIDASVGRLEVRWFAPALLTGELPLWLDLQDLDLRIDADGLAGTGGGAGGGLPVRPQLRELDLRRVRVQVGDAPYTLPDLRVEDLSVSGGGQRLAADGRLVTEEGALGFDATVGLSPFSVEADVRDGDLRIARAWWRGVTGGRAEGTVRYRAGDGVSARLDVTGGSLAAAGLAVDDVAGSVELADALVEADLSGRSLGGPVAATGRVDVANAAWSASVRATPDLAAAAAWGAGDALPSALLPEGEAVVTASVRGWRRVDLEGELVAEGRLAGRPLTLRSERVAYASGDGIRLEAQGAALDGSLGVRAEPAEQGTAWTVTLDDGAWSAAEALTGSVSVTTGAPRTGTFALGTRVDVGGAALGPLDLAVDGEIEGAGLRAFLDGAFAGGGALEGAAELTDGRLAGAVRLRGVGPLAGSDARLEARVAGPPSDLPFTLALQASEPWAPSLPGLAVDTDLRGTLTGRLEGAVLRDLAGSLGPLAVDGTLPLAARDGAAPLRWTLDPVSVRAGPVEARLAVSDGTLTPWASGGTDFGGALRIARAELPGASVSELTAELLGTVPVLATGDPAPLAIRASGPSIEASWRSGEAALALDEQPIALAGRPGVASADLTLRAEAPLASLRGTATLRAGGAVADLVAGDAGVDLDARLPAGTTAGAATLAAPLDVEASLEADLAGSLRASSAGVTLTGTLDADAGRFDGRLATGTAEATLAGGLGPWRVAADGTVSLAALAEVLDRAVDGTLSLDGVALGPDLAEGVARLELTRPRAAQATWRAGELSGGVPLPVGALELSGTARPGAPLGLTARHPWGEAAWRDGRLSGTGTVPELAWRDAALGPTPWRLEGDLARLEAELGDGAAVWEDGRLDARLDAPIRVAGAEGRLTGDVAYAPGSAPLDVDVTVSAGDLSATVRGAAPRLDVTASAPAARLAAATGVGLDLRGRVEASGTVDVDRPSAVVTGVWRQDGAELELTGRWSDGAATLSVAGEGLQASLDGGGVRLVADGFDPAPFVPLAEGVEAQGTLSRTSAGWSGDLTLTAGRTDARSATARLRGEDGALRLDGEARAAGAVTEVEGRLLPHVELSVEGRHAPTGATLDARILGAPTFAPGEAPALAGTVRVPELTAQGYGLAATELRLDGTVRAPTAVDPTGSALRLSDGRLLGTWTLSARVAGVPHVLETTLAGPALDPVGTLTLRGPLADARVDVGGEVPWIEAVASWRAGAWPAALAVAAPGAGELRATLDRSLAWSADVQADLAPAGQDVRLLAGGAGEGISGQASWTLASADGATLLGGDATTTDAGATVGADLGRLDVAAVGALVGVDATGGGEGRLTVRIGGEGLRATADGRVEARIGATAAALELTFDGETGDRARLRLNGDEWVATRETGAWSLRGIGDAYALTGELRGDLGLLQLEGAIADRPATLRAAREDGGDLLGTGTWGESRATLSLRAREDGWRATLDAAVPDRADLPAAGTFSAGLELAGGEVRLTRAEAALLTPLDVRAQLAGTIWPSADVRGAVTGLLPSTTTDGATDVATRAPALDPLDTPQVDAAERSEEAGGAAPEPLALTVRGTPGALVLRAAARGLAVQADLAGTDVDAVRLTGPGRTIAGVRLMPGAEGLAWAPEGGWTGAATVRGPALDGEPLTARLEGAGPELRATGASDLTRGPLDASIALDGILAGAPWSARLGGSATVRARVATADGASRPLALEVPLRFGGTPAAPRATGTARLTGSIEAEGPVAAGLGGATLELAGEALHLAATLDGAGWRAEASLDGVPLATLPVATAGLASARLTAQLDADAAWGAAPRGRVSSWSLVADGLSLRGSGELADTVSLTARLEADLGALGGDGATGRVEGPAVLRADPAAPLSLAELTVALRAEGVRVGGVAADGEVALDGPLGDLSLRGDLTVDGPVAGQLGLSGRLHAVDDEDGASAGRSLDLSLRLDRPAAPPLRLTLAGPAWPTASLTGELSGLLPPAIAEAPATVAVDGTPDDLAARLAVPGLEASARLAGGRPTALRVAGAGLRLGAAELTPDDGGLGWHRADGWSGGASLVWRAGAAADGTARLDGGPEGLALAVELDADPGAGRVDLDVEALATGTPWAARLSGAGRVRAQLAGEPAPLRIEVPLGLGGTVADPTLSGEGTVAGAAGGTVVLDAGRDGATVEIASDAIQADLAADGSGWRADVRADELPLAGLLPTGLEARLSGTGDLSAAWGAGPRGRVHDLRVEAAGAELTGTAVVDEGVSIRADVDARLAPLLGRGAGGRVRGPLSLDAPAGTPLGRAELSVDLRADEVRWGDVRVDGRLGVDGRLPSPDVEADLDLAGPVDGVLRASWRPSEERIDLATELAVGPSPIRVALEVSGGPGTLVAAGAIAGPDGLLRAGSDGRVVTLAGADAWRGAAVTWTPVPRGDERLAVRAPLALVSDGAAAGALEVALTAGRSEWLRASASDPVVLGTPLPDLVARASGGRIDIEGDDASGAVTASLNLPGLTWRVTAERLRPAADVRLALDAAGAGATGSATARVSGPGPDDRARLEVDREASAVTSRASGSVLGGELDADLVRDADGWRGPLGLTGAVTPLGDVDLVGRASGAAALPRLAARLTVDGPVPVDGSVELVASATRAPDAGDGGDAGGGRDGSEPVPAGPRIEVDLGAGLPGGGSLTVAGTAWPSPSLTLAGGEGTLALTAPAWTGGEPWSAEGVTRVALPGTAIELRGEGGPPTILVTPDATAPGALRGELPALAPLPAIRAVLTDGLTLRGQRTLSGSLAWRPPLSATLQDLAWTGPLGAARLSGTVDGGRADLAGRVRLAAEGDVEAEPRGAAIDAAASLLRDLTGGEPVSLSVAGALDGGVVALGGGDAVLSGGLDWARADGGLTADLSLAAPGVDASLSLRPNAGVDGRVRLDGLALTLPGDVRAVLDGEVTADGATLRSDVRLRGPGRVTVEGSAALSDLLPAAYRVEAPAAPSDLSLRVADLEIGALPGLARAVPNLTGGLSAAVEVRGTRVLAQLAVPDLAAAGREIPLRFEGAGDLGAGGGGLELGGAWAGSPLQATLRRDRLDLLLTLERFPVQAPLEAWVGPLDVDAEATGALRVGFPWAAPRDGALRVATERVRLERGGVVTTGTLTASVDRGGLDLRAEFEGRGRWRAEGVIGPELLDFTFEADDADATPLLGLAPRLARLGAGASGDLRLDASGTLDDPRIDARTDGLELALAGARYRLEDALASLAGPELTVDGLLRGVAPVGGALRLRGDGRLRLDPWRLEDAAIALQGDLSVPLIGTVDDVDGAITADPQGRPRLDLTARLGAPLTVAGTLWPLSVSARAEGATLRVPSLLLDESVADLALDLSYDDRLHVTGRVDARQGRFALGIRPPRDEDAPSERSSALERVALDLALSGRRLSFTESIGSAEFEATLALSGTAARPRMSGEARAQRGTFRFSGRDFEVVRGVARFEPSRGVYPSLDVEAVATFRKADVLSGTVAGVSFEQPRGATFDVRLSFDAEVIPTPDEARPFRLSLDPVLTSAAVVSVPAGEGRSGGTRPLTEAELLSLVALGRLDLSGELATGDVAGGVARSAIDSAVDLLVLSELQDALSQALGVDLVQIRTSPISSVLEGDDDPFGVSLRLGGYVDEGLFASFEVGRFAEASGENGLRNTFALTYELGPVALDLATRVDVASRGQPTPEPELTAGLRYQLTPFLAIETGASLSTPESAASFGVTLRW